MYLVCTRDLRLMTDVVAEQDLRVRSIVLRCTGSESGRRNAEVMNEPQQHNFLRRYFIYSREIS